LKIIQSVDRSLKIIDLLSKHDEIGVTEISEKMGLHKSTTHGILTTLESNRFVKQNNKTKKYSLGLKFIEIARIVLDNLDIKNIIKPYLKKLADKYDETVHFAQEDDGMVVYLEKIESSRAVVIKSSVGKRNPMHCTGVGKSILAYMDEKKSDEIIKKPLKKLTKNTKINYNELKKEFEKVRRNGYAIDDEEIEIGLRCISAPIRSHDGKVFGAISISGPSVRMTYDRLEELKLPLTETAMEISKSLGYRDGMGIVI